MTPKQKQVAILLMWGDCNKEIARKLKLNMSTVKFHIQNIFDELEVNNRTQAALKLHGIERKDL